MRRKFKVFYTVNIVFLSGAFNIKYGAIIVGNNENRLRIYKCLLLVESLRFYNIEVSI